jgi:hypothetical protein
MMVTGKSVLHPGPERSPILQNDRKSIWQAKPGAFDVSHLILEGNKEKH